ncbi:MAG: class I SAM-dependent methyltransferase [Candidatus Aminicenantes bacterium]|nr:class I SAM-dependent methyltransferase [Candidatus Aminicenantes bacterium]
MDEKTLCYYAQNADEVFARYESAASGISCHFSEAFPYPGKILDIGAGSGRDVRHLISEGHAAYGVEPCAELRDLTIERHPILHDRIKAGTLPDDLSSFDFKFDGVVCSAVLMHIPREHLFDSLFAVKRILKDDGRLLVSIPSNRSGLDEHRRDSEGRLFSDLYPDYLELLLERIGFDLLRKWEDADSLGRDGVTWTTLLFHLLDGRRLRPLDQIEGVLNRDKKVATYKLTLFRALCEIACGKRCRS